MPDTTFLYGGHTAFQRYAEGSQTNVGLAVDGSLKVTTTLPSYYELAKAGRVYVASSGTATMQAPVTAVPTTAAAWALYNGNTTGLGGFSLLVLDITFWLSSGTPTLGAAFFAGVSPTVQAAAVSAASNTVTKTASGSTRTTAATLGAGVTLAGTPAWRCVGSSLLTAAAGIAGSLPFDPRGSFLIPQGFAMGMTVLASGAGTTPLWGVSVTYAEIESYLV